MIRIFAVFALLTACTRTDLGHPEACGEGSRVVVNNNAFCVYPGAREVVCPEALPFATEYADASFCSIEEYPPPALLAAALRALADAADGGPDAGPDAGLFIVDAAAED